jgi:cell division protein FtsB
MRPPEPLIPPQKARRPQGPEPLRRQRTAPRPAGSRWRRGVTLLLGFVIIVLGVDALVGEKGLTENLRARRASRELQSDVERLRIENAALREHVRRLREDPSAIESVAREELGLIRPGEVLVILKDGKPVSR